MDLLAKAHARLEDYYRWADVEYQGANNDKGIEALRRLKQLIRLIGKIVEIFDRSPKPPKHPTGSIEDVWEHFQSDEFKAYQNAVADRHRHGDDDDLQLYSECAYMIAWRASQAAAQLPELKNFKPPGIRDVRNKLIEHVDGADSGVLIDSFAWGGAQGPVLRAIRYDHQKDVFPDAGLFVNIDEMSNKLIARLDDILKAKTVPPPSS